MGSGQAEAISRTLIAKGLAAGTPVVVVRDASLPQSEARTGTLRELPRLCAIDDDETPGPAVILLGETMRAAVPETAADLNDCVAELIRRTG
jgi:siroheme synthase